MFVREETVIKQLERIKSKLEDNNLLERSDELCIDILIGHLEDLGEVTEESADE